MAIQNRRGVYSDFTPSKMVPGEFAVVNSGDPNSTDGKAVYVSFQDGQAKRLVMQEDVQNEIAKATEDIAEDLTQQIETAVADDVQAAQTAASNASTSAQTANTKASEAAASATQATQTVANIIDNTLTQTGKAADAKKTGDEITQLKGDLNDLGIVYENLYDSSTALENQAVWSDGDVHNSAGNCCSDFVEISPYKTIDVFGTTLICFYDKNKAKISSDNTNTRTKKKTYEVPTNAIYVRVSSKLENKDTIYIGDDMYDLSKFKGKEVSILFVGNSLTHDSVSYVPYIFKTLYPSINFTFYIFYNGGTTLATQYERFANDTPATNFSICSNDIAWKTYWDQYTMAQVLSTFKFDVVCMQDYFTFRSTFAEADLTGWNNCQSYIENNYAGGNPLKFITLMPAPVRDNWTSQTHPSMETVYAATKTAMDLMVQKTAAESVIPCGEVIYKAMQTELDELGDMGHLSHDGLHAQEGIPCLIQAYVVTLWILEKLGICKSVIASPIRMTTEIFETLNVPGENIGTGVITGTDAQNILAQEIAVQAYKEYSSTEASPSEEFIKKIVNRFDKTTITVGKQLYSDMSIHDREGFAITDYIDISDLSSVCMVGISNVVWYDAGKTALSFVNTAVSRTNETVFAIPENAVFLRASVQDTWYDLAQIGEEVFKGNYINHEGFTIEGLRIRHDQIITNDLVRVRGLEYVIPETYGAVGDGVTDDTAAFVSALKNGKPVKLGNKTYKANIEIIRDNVAIIGNGNSSVIIPADTAKPVIKINVDTAETTSDLISFVSIKDIKILGESAVVGLSVRCAQSCIFERVRVESCYAGGVQLRGVFDSRFTDCEIMKCGNTSITSDDGLNNYSISVDKTTGMNTNAVVFEGCRTEHSPRMLFMQNTQQMMFSNCKFESHVSAFSSEVEYAPIRIKDNSFGVNFVNCLMTYNGLLTDTAINNNFNNGNPFIFVDTNGIISNTKTSVLFSGCQFKTQPNYAVKYFSVNYTTFVNCTFDRCTGTTTGNKLKDFCDLIACDFVLTIGSRTLLLDGNNIIVDNVRIHAVAENVSQQVIFLSASLIKGYVKILYTGDDRSNLAGGTISVPVEFIGLRSYG